MKMKITVFSSTGIKTAGDDFLFDTLPARILNAQLPLMENGVLYTRLSDGSVSAISAPEEALTGFLDKKPDSRRMTKDEFIKNLLFGASLDDSRSLCAKYGFLYDDVRRVFIAELYEDVSQYVEPLQEIFEDDNITVVGLDSNRIVIICLECDMDAHEMADAIGATFAELNTDYNVGVSGVADNASMLSNAFEQALEAVEIGKRLAFGGGVWFYSELLPELIIAGLPEDSVRELKKKAEEINKNLDSETVEIAQEFFKHDLNVSETAKHCHFHRNTLMYKLDKIQKDTGFNMRNFNEAVALRIFIAANKVLR